MTIPCIYRESCIVTITVLSNIIFLAFPSYYLYLEQISEECTTAFIYLSVCFCNCIVLLRIKAAIYMVYTLSNVL